MNPIVSIVIATYNSGKTLEKALDSVINQEFQSWECIVVDGLSNDDSINIVRSFVSRDKRIKFISEKDNGIYDAFNKGWKLAKGEWIYYLGSDDRLTKDSFVKMGELIKNCSSNIAVISGQIIRHSRLGREKIEPSQGFYGSHQAKITRRSVLEAMHGFDEKYKILADYDLYIRMEKAGYRALNIDAIIAHFYAGGTSESIKNLREISKERLALMIADPNEEHPFYTNTIMTVKDLIAIIVSKIINK